MSNVEMRALTLVLSVLGITVAAAVWYGWPGALFAACACAYVAVMR